MAGFALRKNTAFEWKGTLYRIDRLQPGGEVLLEHVENGGLSLTSKDVLLAEYGQGNIKGTVMNEPALNGVAPTYSRPLGDLPETVQKELKRRRHYLQFILDQGPPVFTARYLRQLIEEAAKALGDGAPPSVVTIYRWFRRYRASEDPRSLIPRLDRRGPRHERQDPRVMQLVTEAIEEAYKASPLATGQTIYTRLLAKIDMTNRKSLGGEELRPPSLRTLYRLLARTELYDAVRLREGKTIADKRYRIVRAGVCTQHILERAEIDHTPLDVFLVDEKTWLPLGRPTLTVIIDHYSRMLLGYYLTFGAPSAAAVMGALRHAILPKTPAVSAIPGLA